MEPKCPEDWGKGKKGTCRYQMVTVCCPHRIVFFLRFVLVSVPVPCDGAGARACPKESREETPHKEDGCFPKIVSLPYSVILILSVSYSIFSLFHTLSLMLSSSPLSQMLLFPFFLMAMRAIFIESSLLFLKAPEGEPVLGVPGPEAGPCPELDQRGPGPALQGANKPRERKRELRAKERVKIPFFVRSGRRPSAGSCARRSARSRREAREAPPKEN